MEVGDGGKIIVYFLAGARLGNAGYVNKAPKAVQTCSHLMTRPM